ncbi:MAG: hypothetical protein AAF675_15110, partial [Pseudomonadota bacterium]
RIGANSVVVADVAPEVTMVGIPARPVQTETRTHGDPYRVDLDHHLMPDPVGRTLARLADRIAFLEARLAARGVSAEPVAPGPQPACGDAPAQHAPLQHAKH